MILVQKIKYSLYPLFLLGLAYLLFMSNDAKIIIAGIAIFLIGMVFMEDGFKRFSGGFLEALLRKSTNNTFKALLTGFISTSIVQSSSLISIIMISFLGAELITLAGAIGVIIGANLGTTTTAWIIATLGLKIKITQFALPLLIFGVVLRFHSNKSYQGFGDIFLGLGFVFLGISYMKDGFEVLRVGLDLSQFSMSGYFGALVYIFLGVLATVILQSSSATMALIITALATNQIVYINAIELAIGANIGTTITAVLGSLSSNANGKRLALAHFIFNIVTASIAIAFLHPISHLVQLIGVEIGIADDDYTMQLALFHTLFNLIGVLSVAPFTKTLDRFLSQWFVSKTKDISRARFLDNEAVALPEIALVALKKELIHLYDNSTEVISHSLSLHRHTFLGMGTDISKVVESSLHVIDLDIDDYYNRKIKILYGDIIQYATIAQENMVEEDKDRVYSFKIACRDIVESIKIAKELQKNISRSLHSKNEHIQGEYNHLREEIAKVLDGIYTLRNSKRDDFDNLANIKLLEDDLEQFSSQRNKRLDNLIRNAHVETSTATSLMNDGAFVYEISKKLLNVSKLLWIEHREIQKLGEE